MTSEAKTILYPEGLGGLAESLARRLGAELTLCTSRIADQAAMVAEAFPSGDPNVKLSIEAIRDRHVVLLMSQDAVTPIFEQLSVLLFLQRFTVPHALDEYAAGKWKQSVADGRFDVCSAASITVVIPWYRFCQMERTCRWTVKDGKWYNGDANGGYVDVPTAHTFASLLSAEPAEGSLAVPKQLLMIDLHEYEDLVRTLDASNRWDNKPTPFDPIRGSGTYMVSAFDYFLSNTFLPTLRDVAASFVVFPDFGAHRRFYTMVFTQVRHTAATPHQLLRECYVSAASLLRCAPRASATGARHRAREHSFHHEDARRRHHLSGREPLLCRRGGRDSVAH